MLERPTGIRAADTLVLVEVSRVEPVPLTFLTYSLGGRGAPIRGTLSPLFQYSLERDIKYPRLSRRWTRWTDTWW